MRNLRSYENEVNKSVIQSCIQQEMGLKVENFTFIVQHVSNLWRILDKLIMGV
jgi:hypothetical protein